MTLAHLSGSGALFRLRRLELRLIMEVEEKPIFCFYVDIFVMTDALDAVARMGDFLRGRQGVSDTSAGGERMLKGQRDAYGRKVRPPPAVLQRLGIRADGGDIRHQKSAMGLAVTGEVIFTLFASLVLVELFVQNPRVLVGLHSARAVAMLGVALLTLYNMYRGYAYPEVDIRFYSVELLVVMAINIAALVVSSVRVAEKRARGESATWGEIAAVALAGGLVVMNTALLGQQWYRWRLGKRDTPVSSFFTLIMSVVLMGASANSIRNNAKQ